MKSVALNASVRAKTRRNANKQLRTSGRIPATIYGRNSTAQSLDVDAKELGGIFHHSVSENLLIDLTVKDDAKGKRLALVQEVQHHPLSGQVLHIDFHEVAADEMVTISVPVETTGESVGVKLAGGVLEHVMFKLKVRALPKDLPEQLILDVTALEVDKAIHIGDIPPISGVEILGNKDVVVVSCAPAKAEIAEPTAEEAAAAPAAGDVAMIKEKKDEGAPAAAPAKGAAPAKAAAPAAEKKK